VDAVAATAALSDEDLATVRTELSEGKPVTVWFTKAAVGVPADGSAKVISVDDVAEGDFIQVRPAGMRDTMFCSPNELTRTRPARKRAQRPAAKAPEQLTRVTEAAPEPSAGATPPPARPPAPASAPKPVSQPPVPQPVSQPPARDDSAAAERGAERGAERSRPASGRPVARPAEVTVTLNATAEGEWTVEVLVGRKRRVRPTPVQPADVAKAARALPEAVAEAIEASLEAARLRQQERVERLRAELEAAQRALRELSG
jgi:hypothetical protein